MMRKCHANTCPVGVATQDPQLRAHFRGHYRYVVNFFRFLAQEVREYLAEMGFSRLEDIVGRTDLIEIRPTTHEKASLLDFSKLLHKVDNGAALHNVTEQRHEIEHVKDVSMLAAAREALENRKEVSFGICHIQYRPFGRSYAFWGRSCQVWTGWIARTDHPGEVQRFSRTEFRCFPSAWGQLQAGR